MAQCHDHDFVLLARGLNHAVAFPQMTRSIVGSAAHLSLARAASSQQDQREVFQRAGQAAGGYP